jgi:hypothetical protein
MLKNPKDYFEAIDGPYKILLVELTETAQSKKKKLEDRMEKAISSAVVSMQLWCCIENIAEYLWGGPDVLKGILTRDKIDYHIMNSQLVLPIINRVVSEIVPPTYETSITESPANMFDYSIQLKWHKFF